LNAFIKREHDYALRISAYLAGISNRAVAPISTISSLLSISRPFATKIIFRLKKSGFVGTVQGKDGGVFLTKLPTEISLLDILVAVGFKSRLNECMNPDFHCPMIQECKLYHFFEGQEQQLLQALRDTKISDVAFTNTDLHQKT